MKTTKGTNVTETVEVTKMMKKTKAMKVTLNVDDEPFETIEGGLEFGAL